MSDDIRVSGQTETLRLEDYNNMFLTTTYIFAVMLLVLANGFFVASEFSLVAVRRSRVAALAADGNRSAKVLLELIDNLNSFFPYLPSCLNLNGFILYGMSTLFLDGYA